MTLAASAVSYRGRLFHSLAHFEVEGRGGLDLARDPALDGDFTGAEPHARRLGGPPPQPDAEGRVEKTPQSGGDGPPHTTAAGGTAGPGTGLGAGAALVLQPPAVPHLAANRPRAGLFLLPPSAWGFFRRGLCGGFKEYIYANCSAS